MANNQFEVYDRGIRIRTNSDMASTDESFQSVSEDVVEFPPTFTPKPKSLSLPKIFLLNAVVCGVEICACAGFTYIPPMLLKKGYTEENMSIILGFGPFLGFFLVPLIGRASDRCQSSFGRRRPFILAISLILILSLIVIPYCDMISRQLFGVVPFSKTFSVLLITVAVVLLDLTSQACLTPCEALLSDASKDTGQQGRAFIVYSLMVSIGGFLGYLITALDWNNTSIGVYLGTQERTVFTILVILFTILLSATLLEAKEIPLSQIFTSFTNSYSTDKLVDTANVESGYTSSTESNNLIKNNPANKLTTSDTTNKRRGRTLSSIIAFTRLPHILLKYTLSCKLAVFIVKLLHGLWINVHSKLPEPIQRLCEVPFVLRHLVLTHFCSWTAVMGFNLFFTDYVGNAVYQGNPAAPEGSYLRNRFDEGVRMGSWGLLLHCITSAGYALVIERLTERFGCKRTYMFGMLSFSMAMFAMVWMRDVKFVSVMAALTGFGYATLTTIPFILVSKYHQNKQVYFFDVIPSTTDNGVHLPTRGIGMDMATLDSAYFLSQVVLSCLMGYIVYMTGSVASYMVTAGVMGIISCFCIQNIIVDKQDLESHLLGSRKF